METETRATGLPRQVRPGLRLASLLFIVTSGPCTLCNGDNLVSTDGGTYIQGTVLDARTSQPVAGVAISSDDASVQGDTITDTGGNFRLYFSAEAAVVYVYLDLPQGYRISDAGEYRNASSVVRLPINVSLVQTGNGNTRWMGVMDTHCQTLGCPHATFLVQPYTPATLVERVVDPQGRGVPGMQIQTRCSNFACRAQAAVTDSRGEIVMLDQLPGTRFASFMPTSGYQPAPGFMADQTLELLDAAQDTLQWQVVTNPGAGYISGQRPRRLATLRPGHCRRCDRDHHRTGGQRSGEQWAWTVHLEPAAVRTIHGQRHGAARLFRRQQSHRAAQCRTRCTAR